MAWDWASQSGEASRKSIERWRRLSSDYTVWHNAARPFLWIGPLCCSARVLTHRGPANECGVILCRNRTWLNNTRQCPLGLTYVKLITRHYHTSLTVSVLVFTRIIPALYSGYKFGSKENLNSQQMFAFSHRLTYSRTLYDGLHGRFYRNIYF